MQFMRLLTISVLLATFSAAATAPSPPPDQFVTIDGVRLQYVDWGGHGDVLLPRALRLEQEFQIKTHDLHPDGNSFAAQK